MSAEPPEVVVDHVSKLYHGGHRSADFMALENVDLAVGKGEFVTLLGPSGCGKTTLLKAIDGLLPVTSGEIRVAGNAIRGPGPERAVVFQDFRLLPWRTVLGNVTFPIEASVRSRREREAVATKYIEMVGLGNFSSRHPHELSGGMQQRVGLARALAMDPSILLMDEPFGALDAQTRELMQVELRRIWTITGKTVIFVTHDVDEALFLSQRIVVFGRSPGRVVEEFTVPFANAVDQQDVRSDPRSNQYRERIWRLLKRDREAHGSPGDVTVP